MSITVALIGFGRRGKVKERSNTSTSVFSEYLHEFDRHTGNMLSLRQINATSSLLWNRYLKDGERQLLYTTLNLIWC